MATAADLILTARARAGISQRALAIRAGTKQSTISRLESGAEEPTLERLERLLTVMGFRMELQLTRLAHSLDPRELAAAQSMTPAERLREAASWNKLATQVSLAVDARAERR